MSAAELLADARRIARQTLVEIEDRAGTPRVAVSDADVPRRIVLLARLIAMQDASVVEALAGRVIAAPTASGGYVMVDLGDWTSWVIVEQRGWEPVITELALRGIKPGAVVLDVGAHIGGHALAYAQRAGATGRVFAFEPFPANLTLLRHTIAVNGLESVITAEPLAIGDQVGSARLHAYSPESTAARYRAGSGMLQSLVVADDYAREAIDVPVTTLDEWSAAQGVDQVDFIKIDVEGAELMVLRGARALLVRSPKVKLVVETHPVELAAAGSSVAEVLAALRAEGFSLFEALANHAGTMGLVEVGATLHEQHVLARR